MSWDEVDQDKALAWLWFDQSRCRNCGTRKTEWEADRFAYVGEADRCLGCEALAQEQDNLPEGKEARGMRVYLVPRHQATTPDEEG